MRDDSIITRIQDLEQGLETLSKRVPIWTHSWWYDPLLFFCAALLGNIIVSVFWRLLGL